MKIVDPDTFVSWERVDEPGDVPTWESQCGKVEERDALYFGFVGPRLEPLPPTTTVLSAKRFVERDFQKQHVLKWNYEKE